MEERITASLGLGSVFAIGYVILTDGPGADYAVGGADGFMLSGGSILLVASLALAGAGMVTLAAGERAQRLGGWGILGAAGVLFLVLGDPIA